MKKPDKEIKNISYSMLPQILDLLMLSQVCCSYSKRPIVIATHFFRNPLLDQWLKGVGVTYGQN